MSCSKQGSCDTGLARTDHCVHHDRMTEYRDLVRSGRREHHDRVARNRDLLTQDLLGSDRRGQEGLLRTGSL